MGNYIRSGVVCPAIDNSGSAFFRGNREDGFFQLRDVLYLTVDVCKKSLCTTAETFFEAAEANILHIKAVGLVFLHPLGIEGVGVDIHFFNT